MEYLYVGETGKKLESVMVSIYGDTIRTLMSSCLQKILRIDVELGQNVLASFHWLREDQVMENHVIGNPMSGMAQKDILCLVLLPIAKLPKGWWPPTNTVPRPGLVSEHAHLGVVVATVGPTAMICNICYAWSD